MVEATSCAAGIEDIATRNKDVRVCAPNHESAPALPRLADLYERKGDLQKAALYAGRLVDLWKNADAELQPRVQAMRALLQRVAGDRAR